MIFKINDGTDVNIEIGMRIKCVSGYLPASFDNKFIDILEIDGYPMAQIEESQLSCISPEIITEVL